MPLILRLTVWLIFISSGIFTGKAQLFAQQDTPLYYEAKVKYTRSTPQTIKWIKIYSFDGEADVFLKHRDTEQPVAGYWYLMDDPGGSVELFTLQQDTLCGIASRGQIKSSIYRQNPHTWRLEFTTGTYWVEFEGEENRALVYQKISLPGEEQTKIPLLTLELDQENQRYLNLVESETLRDIPPLAYIMAVTLTYARVADAWK